jgi:hypothetical protein
MNAEDIKLIAAALRVARKHIADTEPKSKRAGLANGVDRAATFIAVMLADCADDAAEFEPIDFLVECGNELDVDGLPVLPNHAH